MKKLITILFIIHCSSIITQAQWVQQPSGVNVPLYNVQFVNLFTGWVTGGNSVILKTTDGGINWFQQTIDLGYPKNLFGLSMIDVNTGYIAGWFETILKTTNSGSNWNIISNIPSNTGLSNGGSSFINAQTGWICSSLGRVLRTTDGGMNWDTSYAGGIMYSIQFLNNLNGWLCGDDGIYRSVNGGMNWISCPFLTTASMSALHFINTNTGWAVSEQFRLVFKTTNAGINWDTIAVIPGGPVDFLYSVHFVNALTGWTGGSNSLLFKSTNGGFNWIQQSISPVMYISGLSFLYDSIGWAVGGNHGTIVHTSNGGTYVGIKPLSNIIPKDFKLYQNYPNPFNPETTIDFDIAKADRYKLVIYDLLGREVAKLLNEFKKPGKYKISFNGNSLSSGTYFYKLTSANNSETMKFILLK